MGDGTPCLYTRRLEDGSFRIVYSVVEVDGLSVQGFAGAKGSFPWFHFLVGYGVLATLMPFKY